MAELRFQTTAMLPPKTVTARVSAATPERGANPLQDSFIRLEEADRLRQERKLDRAQKICDALVRQYPDYMGALHTLGLIYADKKNYQRAFDCLARAAMLNPRSWKTLTALSGVYLQLGAKEMAAQALEQARRIEPRDTNVLVTLGEIYFEENEYELARDVFRQALELEVNLLPAEFGLGWAYAFLGQDVEAAKVFEGIIERGLRRIDPVFALSSLPASVVKIDLLRELDKVVKDENEDAAELENTAAFVRAAALDNLGRHAEAWELLVPANRTLLNANQKELDGAILSQRASLARLRKNSTKVSGVGVGGGQTISLFVVGPSRSGKTSMEQLVATLDGVKRGYENPIVEMAISRAFQTANLITSSHFENLPGQLHPLCRDIYLEELARRAGPARVFTNTHPGRIHDALAIAGAFPNARFIFVKRKLEDILLRMYMRKYSKGNIHAYNLKAAQDHVICYHQMMDLLAEKMPDIVRVIHYEDMVADPPAALRVAAELCGLPMHEGPLRPVGDDRGCAEPYRDFMAAALAD